MLLGEGGESQGICNPLYMPGARPAHLCLCRRAKCEDFLARLLNLGKWSQSAYFDWGPVLSVLCVYVSWTVCPGVCVYRRRWG